MVETSLSRNAKDVKKTPIGTHDLKLKKNNLKIMLKREPGLLTATNAILMAQPITLLTLLLLKFLYKKSL